MSTAHDEPAASSVVLGEFPVFDLECLFDEPVEPTEVTIFSPSGFDITSHWITIDMESAVPIEAMR